MNKLLVTMFSLVLAGSTSFAARPSGGGGHASSGGHSSGGGGHSAPARSAPVRSAPVRSAPVHSAPVRSAPVAHAPARPAPVQHTPVQHTPVANHPTAPVNHGGGTVHNGGTTHNGGTVHNGGTTHNGGTVHNGGTTHNGGTVHNGGQTHNGFANGTHGTYKGSTHVTINNRTYVSRTYVNNRGVAYHGYYAPRSWGGRPYYAFYGHWGYGAPFWGVYWGVWNPLWVWPWVWATSPWYTNYWGWYYHPYVTYAYPYQWVADYAYQDTLNSAYQAGLAAGQQMSNSQAGGTPISDADHAQLSTQTADISKRIKAGTDIDVKDMLADPNYLFVASQPLTVVPLNETKGCALSGGDIFKVVTAPTPTSDTATLMVTAVKAQPNGCTAGARFSMSVSDLQELVNSWAERVEKGNHDFETKETKGQSPVVAQP